METTSPPATSRPELQEALVMAQPLVDWLLKSGVGYGEFVAALKPLFLARAESELDHHGLKSTDSAVSLLSGLHRKDVRALRALAAEQAQGVRDTRNDWGKPSLASQVITRWLGHGGVDIDLPLSGAGPSFESLVAGVSKDVHARTVLQELVRLGVAQVDEADGGTRVRLVQQAFVPDPQARQAKQLLAAGVADHIAAGVHNLCTQGQGKFLEQSVFADELSPESVKTLHQLANRLWAQVLQSVVEAATPLCERDKNHPTPQRFRLGMFTFSENHAPASAHPSSPEAHAS